MVLADPFRVVVANMAIGELELITQEWLHCYPAKSPEDCQQDLQHEIDMGFMVKGPGGMVAPTLIGYMTHAMDYGHPN